MSEKFVDEIVTKFLLNTTRLCPQPSKLAVLKTALCVGSVSNHPPNDNEADYIPLITGSAAEFYIEPILPHFGDIDMMCHLSTQLAIPRGHLPPTQLPAEFHDYVRVYEIIDSHLPGYVYLELRYLLTKCTDGSTYDSVHYDRQQLLRLNTSRAHVYGIENHGPALMHRMAAFQLDVDEVPCVRCLLWAPQAADWPTRHRNYGWPDSATVDRVLSNGCDVVSVAHRQCRQVEWMGNIQWRLSFSRAEVVLMNSWMPVQQIVYHLLRVFMKTERLTDSADNSEAGTLSNYHIKTLMLWACEMKPINWWTDNLSLVRICVELLHILAVFLTETRCQHYFISNCNLVDKSFNLEVTSRLLLIDKLWLSSWFVINYIRKSSQICSGNVSRLFDDLSTDTKLQHAVSAVVQWRLNRTLEDMWLAVDSAKLNIAQAVSTFSVTARSCVYWLTALSKIHACLPLYFTAFTFLHIAHKTERSGLSENLKKALAATVNQFVASSDYYKLSDIFILTRKCHQLSENSTERNTSQLTESLRTSAVEHLTTFFQLEARDFGSVVPILTTEFAALYAYKHGNCEQCLQLLSTQNVHTTPCAVRLPRNVSSLPEFIQLLDDDIVSLTALTLIVCPKTYRITSSFYATITQLTLSLYLMTQCHLKLRHSVTSLAHVFYYTQIAQRRHRVNSTLDQLTLKLIQRKILIRVGLTEWIQQSES